jgi:hypothetical protein
LAPETELEQAAGWASVLEAEAWLVLASVLLLVLVRWRLA